jgi:DNA-directed RNA polymerase I subunit RPA2
VGLCLNASKAESRLDTATIGDKFSSRHGQKGICSMKWPVENMPFTESGMTPDIIFNPHGFPSRMTIGMMIESMAGKSSASHGLLHDATPFTFTEDCSAIDHFGQLLTKAGYNYYGTERMYSGADGREFEADIFMGVVYYQRLRHMVSDKFQVRTTGPVDQLTLQPIKGRKRGGGVRFGEMERDGLLSHGTSFLLEDRLLNCSDKTKGFVCCQCGSILSPLIESPETSAAATYEARKRWACKVCQTHDTVKLVNVPHVFKYLVAELAAMNIKTTLDVREVGSH